MKNNNAENKKPQVVIMAMQDADNVSGVSRFVEMLLGGLDAHHSEINVCSVQFVLDSRQLFPRRIRHPHYDEWKIPLPVRMEEVIHTPYWMQAYNAFVFNYLKKFLVPGCLLHLNTLNLIDLAVYIRERMPCRILSHLHCIPWKSYYNSNRKEFNDLYHRIYNRQGSRKELVDRLRKRLGEMDFYHQSDCVVCVTKCAATFQTEYMDVPTHKIEVVYNGIADRRTKGGAYSRFRTSVTRILYAGILLESKGIHFILDALRIVRSRGYDVELLIAGHCPERRKNILLNLYRDIPCQVLGLIPFEELIHLYEICDLGVIASLQEQCSYVALEMMMFGLPVVSTLVDGLGEIFVDGQTALGVDTRFSPVLGLSVDSEQMADQIIRMIDNPALCGRLSDAGRQRYEAEFTRSVMTGRIMNIYRKLLNQS